MLMTTPGLRIRRALRRAALLLAALSLAPWPVPLRAGTEADAHHHHHAAATAPGQRTLASYPIPDVTLLDTQGAAVPLRRLLAETDRPVLLNFIYTSCGTVCPVMSATFAQVQAALGPQREAVRMISISIDPEQDTPAVLKAYADRFAAGPQWQMLTGRLADSIAVQRAFNVYRGDKMAHQPATFLRAAADQPWVRLDGLASAAEIVREVRRLRTH